jgi:hypothetical protein
MVVDQPGSYLDDSTVANGAVVAHSSDPVSVQHYYIAISKLTVRFADQRRQVVDVDGKDHRRGVHILDEMTRVESNTIINVYYLRS